MATPVAVCWCSDVRSKFRCATSIFNMNAWNFGFMKVNRLDTISDLEIIAGICLQNLHNSNCIIELKRVLP